MMRASAAFFLALVTLGAVAASCSSQAPQKLGAPTTSATVTGAATSTSGSQGGQGGQGGAAGQGGQGGAAGQGGQGGGQPHYDGGSDAADPCHGCRPMEYCGYADSLCGKGIKSPVCLPIMNIQACTPPTPACGCDGKLYASRCAAGALDVDIDENGGCTAMPGFFACEGVFCNLKDEYCRLTPGLPPFCAPRPMSCSFMMAHDGGGGAAPAPEITCTCVKAGDPKCPVCTGTPSTGITVSKCM